MSLRRKIMIYVAITTLCSLSLLYMISERMLLRGYEQMEANTLRENMRQSLLSFYDEYTNLGAIAINYAGWNDTYELINRPEAPAADDPYFTNNYTDSLFTSSRMNVTLLLNTRKQIYFGKAYDYAHNRPLPYPGPLIRTLIEEHPAFIEQPDASSRKQGLLLVQNQPWIAASYPILTSNNEGPVRGTLVFARMLDSNYSDYISRKTDIPLSFTVVDPAFTPPRDAAALTVHGDRSVTFWTEQDKKTVSSFALLTDVDGKPALLLSFVKPRDLYSEAQKSILFYLLYFGLSGLVFFVTMNYVLERTLFARVKQAMSGMNAIETKKDLSIRIKESGRDEITRLVQSFNHMMNSLEQAQNELQFQAEHDDLTGLANRKGFFTRLEKTIRQCEKHHERFALLFIDLDRFKWINDTMGHPTGDLLLMEAANRLKICLQEGDFLSRLGGDEFCIISLSAGHSGQTEHLVERIRKALDVPFQLEDYHTTISASIGISLYPEHGTDSQSLLLHADTAMLAVKENGKNNYSWYSEAFEQSRMRRMRIEQYLKDAVAHGEMGLLYQPKWDLAERRMAGVEALLRWTHPQLGVVPPNEFIPVAEASGIINDIGEWIVRTACRQFAEWQSGSGGTSLIVAVNISGVQLLQPGFVGRIRRIFEEEQVNPRHFELEVTESFAIEKFEKVIDVFAELRSLGFQISIDDFGAGYSSLKYLSRLPVQCLKIDKTLVDHLGEHVRSQVIVSTLIEMSHRLGISVVAEGVEQPEQLHKLQMYGCDQIQGYLFSEPVPADRVIDLLALDAFAEL